MRVLIVSNDASGSADGETLAEVRRRLDPLGDVDELRTGSAESLDEDVRAAAGSRDLVVVAGGDGTLNCVVNALRKTLEDYTFAVVPMGTGNDFARTLGIPDDPVEAATALAEGREAEIDYGVASGPGVDRVFLNACMGGFPIEVDKAIEGPIKKRFGPLAFWVGGIKAATDFSRFKVNVSGTQVEECVAIGIGNGRTAGGGIAVWPDADPSDGSLDVCAISAGNIAQAFHTAARARSGEHVNRGNVFVSRGNEVRVEADPAIEFNVDGEVLGLETPAVFSVGGRIKVRIPTG